MATQRSARPSGVGEGGSPLCGRLDARLQGRVLKPHHANPMQRRATSVTAIRFGRDRLASSRPRACEQVSYHSLEDSFPGPRVRPTAPLCPLTEAACASMCSTGRDGTVGGARLARLRQGDARSRAGHAARVAQRSPSRREARLRSDLAQAPSFGAEAWPGVRLFRKRSW